MPVVPTEATRSESATPCGSLKTSAREVPSGGDAASFLGPGHLCRATGTRRWIIGCGSPLPGSSPGCLDNGGGDDGGTDGKGK